MNLGEMVVSFSCDLSKLTSGIAEAKAKIGEVGNAAQVASHSTGSGFAGAVGSVLDFSSRIAMTVIGVKGLADGVIGLGRSLIQGNADMETAAVSFKAFLGSAEATDKLLKQLASFAATTPFAFPEIQQASLSLLNMGVKANDVTKYLTNIGDAVAKVGGSGQTFEDVAAIIAQMGVKGKVTTEEMMQLTERNIPAFQILANAMHVPVATLQDMISKGQLGKDKIDLLVTSMGKFGSGAMVDQGKTFNGMLSTLIDTFNQALNTFSKPLFDFAKSGLADLNTFLSGPAIQNFATMMGQGLGTAIQVVTGFVRGQLLPAFIKLAPVAQDLGMWFVRSFQQMLPIIGQVGQILGQVFGHIVDYISSDQFADVIADFEGLGNQIQQIVGGGLQLLGPLIEQSFAILGPILTGVVIPAIDTLVFDISQVISFFQQNQVAANILAIAVGALAAAFIAFRVVAIVGMISGFISLLPLMYTMITLAIPGMIGGLLGMATAALPFILVGLAIALVIAGVILAIQHWGEITKFLQGVWANFTSWFMGMLSGLGAFFTGLWAGLLGGLKSAWSTIVSIARLGAQLLFNVIFGPIMAIGALFVWLYNHNTYFKRLIDAIRSVVSAGVAWLQSIWTGTINKVVGEWNRLVGLARAIWAAIQFIVQSLVNSAIQYLQVRWTAGIAWLRAQWNSLVGLASAVWAAVSAVFSSIWSRYISGPLNSLWGQISGWFSNLATQAGNAGHNFINMLVSGITNGVGAIWNAVTNIANTIWKALGFHSPPKGGPLRDSDKYMPRFVDMMASGLIGGVPKIARASNILASHLAIAPGAYTSGSMYGGTTGISTAGGSGDLHIYLEVDGEHLAHIVAPHIDGRVRAKFGPRGRA